MQAACPALGWYMLTLQGWQLLAFAGLVVSVPPVLSGMYVPGSHASQSE
jgi:hypothetical protein